MEEIWKPIPGYEGFYEVSNLGNFLSLRSHAGKRPLPKILKTKKHRDGYLYININKNKVRSYFSAHRTVAKVFIQNQENKKEVNHKNCIKSDNRVENLEWVTPRDNVDHALKMGRYNLQIRRGRAGAKCKTQNICICHPPLKAVGEKNQCKSCYMRDWRNANKEHIKQSRMIYNRNVRYAK